MKIVKIFCEGVTDQVFIADCLEFFYQIKVDREINGEKVKMSFKRNSEIIELNGCGNLSKDIYIDQLKDNQEEDGINIIILDADFSSTAKGEKKGTGNNGFKACKQKLEDIKKQHNVSFDYYLWHNNQDDGEVEDLICQLIPKDKQPVMDCIENHKSCLQQIEHLELNIADLKNQISFYLGTLKQDSGPRKRDYKNNNHWKLDINENDTNIMTDLMKFKIFLDKYFL